MAVWSLGQPPSLVPLASAPGLALWQSGSLRPQPPHEATAESQQDSSKYPLPVPEGCWQASESLQPMYVCNPGLPATLGSGQSSPAWC